MIKKIYIDSLLEEKNNDVAYVILLRIVNVENRKFNKNPFFTKYGKLPIYKIDLEDKIDIKLVVELFLDKVSENQIFILDLNLSEKIENFPSEEIDFDLEWDSIHRLYQTFCFFFYDPNEIVLKKTYYFYQIFYYILCYLLGIDDII